MDQNWNGGNAPQNQNPGMAPAPQMPPVNNVMPNPAMAAPMGMPAPQLQTVAPMPGAMPINQVGERKGTLAETIILVIVCLIAAAAIVAAVIFYMNWNELQADFEVKKAEAVASAEKNQKDLDEKTFSEREKTPVKEFQGPSDYGSISFNYPKTWSVYIQNDGSNNSDFEAFFAPVQVNSTKSKDSRYALRFTIKDKPFETVQKDYQTKVNKGELKATIFNADDTRITGSLYQGTLDKNMIGQVLIIKVNDKTAILQTDVDNENYRTDFEALIKTLRRNS